MTYATTLRDSLAAFVVAALAIGTMALMSKDSAAHGYYAISPTVMLVQDSSGRYGSMQRPLLRIAE